MVSCFSFGPLLLRGRLARRWRARISALLQPALLSGLFLFGGVVGCAEYLPMSGGALEGTLTAAPANWSEVASAEIVQLETNPEEPYSVNLWVIGEGQSLYVFAGDNHTRWVQHIESDPRVRLKIGELIYELSAQRVTDAQEFERFAKAWDGKYGHRPRNEDVTQTFLMVLNPRRS